MSTVQKSKISVEEIVADIFAGRSTSALMAKHQLTPEEFHEEIVDLLDRGLDVKVVLTAVFRELHQLRCQLEDLGEKAVTRDQLEAASKFGQLEQRDHWNRTELTAESKPDDSQREVCEREAPEPETRETGLAIEDTAGLNDHVEIIISENTLPPPESPAPRSQPAPPTDTVTAPEVVRERLPGSTQPSASTDLPQDLEFDWARSEMEAPPLEQPLEGIQADAAPAAGLHSWGKAEVPLRLDRCDENEAPVASPPVESPSSRSPFKQPARAISARQVTEWDWATVESTAAVWGTRAGVLIVVMGLGYLLSIGFGKLGILGKVSLVYVACLGMLGAGMVFEKIEKYSTWAKVMIAGGWAAVYITTFMIHYLPEARLIQAPSTDMFLLMAVAAGMIIHSFKYRSQSLTILTYSIAFVTIALSIHLASQTFFSLIATAVLAVSMLTMLYTLHWYRLALFCLIACYGTHLLWATPLVSGFRAPMGHGTEFWGGLFMIFLYWITFTVGACLARPRDKEEEAISLTMTALNFLLFVLVFRYHVGTGHPELAWCFIGSLLVAYAVLAYFAYTWERVNLFRLLLVIAVVCSTATLYLKLGTKWAAMGWTVQAQMLYTAGLLRNERGFRWLGIATFVLVGMWFFGTNFLGTEQLSLGGLRFYSRTLMFTIVALLLYTNALVRRFLQYRIEEQDTYSYLFSYAASVLWLMLVFKNWFPQDVLMGSVMTAILGFALIEIGIRRQNHHFGIQGMFFSFLATGGALYPLQVETGLYYDHGMLYRIACEAGVIAAAYLGFVRLQKKGLWEDTLGNVGKVSSIIAAVASAVSATLLYREFAPVAPVWLSLAWTVFGALLLEAGLAIRNPVFRYLGYSVTGLALGWTLYGFLGRPDWFHVPQFQTLSLSTVIAGFFYQFVRLRGVAKTSPSELLSAERLELLPGTGPLPSVAFSAGATSLLLLLLRQELLSVSPLLIATSWILAAIVLLEVGFAIRGQALRWEALAVSDVAFVYALVNSLGPGHVWLGGLNERMVAFILDIAGMYYICERFFRIEKTKQLSLKESYGAVQLSWAAGILLVILIQWELWTPIAPAWVGTVWLLPLIAFFVLSRTRRSLNFLAQWGTLAAVIFLWTCLRTIPATGPAEIARFIDPYRILAVVPIIAVLYAIFWNVRTRQDVQVKDIWARYESYGGEAASWAASIVLVALVTVEVDQISWALTTTIWAVIGLILFETGRATESRALRTQTYVLAAATCVRAVLSYYVAAPTSWTPVSISVVVAVLLYLYFRLRASEELTYLSIREELLSAPMICLVAAVLLPALYHEVRPPAWIPVAWGGLLLFIMVLGTSLRDRILVRLSLIIALPVMVGIWYFNLTKGVSQPEAIPVLLALATLFSAQVLWQFKFYALREHFVGAPEEWSFLAPLDRQRHLLSVPAAVLLFIAIVIVFPSKYLTLAWGCEGLLLAVLGLALRDRILRFLGLGLLAVCFIKVLFDLYILDIDRIFKVMALIGLGLILIFTGWIYSRYREKIVQLILD